MIRRLLIALLLSAPCFGQLWSGIIAPARGVDWATYAGAVPGSPGTLPSDSWPQCGATIAAFGTSGTPASPAPIVTALTNAVNGTTCSGHVYVLLGPGDFYLSTGFNFPTRSLGGHVELRASGNATRVHFSGTVACNGTGAAICIAGDGTFPAGGGTGVTIVNWTAGFAQGATQITLSSVAGMTAGKTLLVLKQCDTGFSGAGCLTGASIDNGGYFICSVLYNSGSGHGCGANGPDTGSWEANDFEQEIVQVTAINQGGCGATCVTISHPLWHPNWALAQNTRAVLVQPAIQEGVRNMVIDGSPNAANQTAIGAQDTYQMWVSGVVIHDFYEFAVYDLVEANTTIQNTYAYHSNGHPDAYAFRTTCADSDLILNNVIQQWKNSFAHDGPAVATVVAYNYSINQIIPSPSDFMWGSFWTHSAGDDYMLREGNMGDQAQDDNVHGTHMDQSSLRNFFWGFESCKNGATGANNCGGFTAKTSASTAFVESSGVRYSNNIGNVLGTPGFTTNYQSTAAFSANAAWNVGGGNGVVGLPADPLVLSTMLMWSNWDVVNQVIMDCTALHTPVAACTEDDRGTTAPTYPGLSSPSTTIPPSFLFNVVAKAGCGTGIPFWKNANTGTCPQWPPIGPSVASGNVKMCTGTLNTTAQAGLPTTDPTLCGSGAVSTQWAGMVNANPAMQCYINAGGLPDGTNATILAIDPAACWSNDSAGSIVATPTFVPVAGSYGGTQNVVISTTTVGATLCYTVDGSTPTANGSGSCTHGTTYSGAVAVSSSKTLKAIGSLTSFSDSSVATAVYTINGAVATPTFSPVAGSYSGTQSVTLLSTAGATLCYTIDGSTPTANGSGTCTHGTTYSGPISVSLSETVKAVGSKSGFTDSAVGSAAYTINLSGASGVTFSNGTVILSGGTITIIP